MYGSGRIFFPFIRNRKERSSENRKVPVILFPTMDKNRFLRYNGIMKYLVVSDLHGSVSGYGSLNDLLARELPDSFILLGDLTRYGVMNETTRGFLAQLTMRPVAVEGNCDNGCGDVPELDYRGDYYVASAFGKTLFFTHGHIYNITHIPPFLKDGDILIYGHTHAGGLTKHQDVLFANCPSLSSPRGDGVCGYLTIEDKGIFLKEAEKGDVLEQFLF